MDGWKKETNIDEGRENGSLGLLKEGRKEGRMNGWMKGWVDVSGWVCGIKDGKKEIQIKEK